MPEITLNLVVLRSGNMERLVAFYMQLGLRFEAHRHEKGPEHYAAELAGGGVFEIYPPGRDGALTTGTRIGFGVPSIEAALAALAGYPDAVGSPPQDSEWGQRAAVTDPDGHRVELLER